MGVQKYYSFIEESLVILEVRYNYHECDFHFFGHIEINRVDN
jgi:hypothetical protein